MSTQWASGSNPPDSNVLTVAEHMTYQQGPWHFEVNGSGLLDSILNPEAQRTSLGKVNNYVIQLADQKKAWGANLRFGTVSPSLYTDAQYVSAATPRQGVELAVKTPEGTFSGFTNTNDAAFGGGSSMNVQQRMEGASWQAPLPKWAHLRLMWLNATDIGASGGLKRLWRCVRGAAQHSIDKEVAMDIGVCGESRQSKHRCRKFNQRIRPRMADSNYRAARQNKSQHYIPRCKREFRQPDESRHDAEQPAQCARRECGNSADH